MRPFSSTVQMLGFLAAWSSMVASAGPGPAAPALGASVTANASVTAIAPVTADVPAAADALAKVSAASSPAGSAAPKASAPPGAATQGATEGSNDTLREQVRRAEAAFAKTMADRDHAAFVAFLADEAIFVSPRRTLRGKQAIADGWKRFYEGKEAPFSWAPDKVEVVESGTLALSQGPVMDPSGKRVGTFNSTWRRERDGQWKIVLDNGCPDCECPPAGATQGK